MKTDVVGITVRVNFFSTIVAREGLYLAHYE